jgi:hypothetical protein
MDFSAVATQARAAGRSCGAGEIGKSTAGFLNNDLERREIPD